MTGSLATGSGKETDLSKGQVHSSPQRASTSPEKPAGTGRLSEFSLLGLKELQGSKRRSQSDSDPAIQWDTFTCIYSDSYSLTKNKN